jgi:hypothetical protein
MWRDIDSLRKQNESTKKEIESMRRKSKQTEIETEQLRSETEILRRQNRALELIESSDLNALLREATIPGGNDSDHSEGQLDLDLLAEKFVALGCDVDDIPFLFDVLELTKEKELSPLRPMPEGLSQAIKIPSLHAAQLPIGRQQQRRGTAEYAYISTSDRLLILRILGPEGYYLERIIFPFEMLNFTCPNNCEVQVWTHGLGGPELCEIISAEDLRIKEPDATAEQVGLWRFETG